MPSVVKMQDEYYYVKWREANKSPPAGIEYEGYFRFYEKDHILSKQTAVMLHMNPNPLMFRVHVPDDVVIRQEGILKFVNRARLDEGARFKDWLANQSYDWKIECVKRYGYAIRCIDPKEHTVKMCMLAVNNDPTAFFSCGIQTEKLCKLAVTADWRNLTGVNEQSEELCSIAIQGSYRAIALVKEQTPELCTIAIRKNVRAIQHIKNPSELLCMEAVSRNGMVLRFINNQTIKICRKALEQNPRAWVFVDLKFKLLDVISRICGMSRWRITLTNNRPRGIRAILTIEIENPIPEKNT